MPLDRSKTDVWDFRLEIQAIQLQLRLVRTLVEFNFSASSWAWFISNSIIQEKLHLALLPHGIRVNNIIFVQQYLS